jgi:hypothetical protein
MNFSFYNIFDCALYKSFFWKTALKFKPKVPCVFNQEQFQCANVVFACLYKLCVAYVGWNQGDGSKGWVEEGVGPVLCKMRQLSYRMGPEQTGIHIHASKVITPSKDFYIKKPFHWYFVQYIVLILYIFSSSAGKK